MSGKCQNVNHLVVTWECSDDCGPEAIVESEQPLLPVQVWSVKLVTTSKDCRISSPQLNLHQWWCRDYVTIPGVTQGLLRED